MITKLISFWIFLFFASIIYSTVILRMIRIISFYITKYNSFIALFYYNFNLIYIYFFYNFDFYLCRLLFDCADMKERWFTYTHHDDLLCRWFSCISGNTLFLFIKTDSLRYISHIFLLDFHSYRNKYTIISLL